MLDFRSISLQKDVNHATAPRNEHSSNRTSEKAIQDVINPIKSYKADSGVPSQCWDIIGQHACLINVMCYPSPRNADIIISESRPNFITHSHSLLSSPNIKVFTGTCARSTGTQFGCTRFCVPNLNRKVPFHLWSSPSPPPLHH